MGARAFVLNGAHNPLEQTNTVAWNKTAGGIKELKRFARWNIPEFTYSFDASFVNYFGMDGIDAVHEAINVINDFFENEDYSGVDELDFLKHGFAGNYNTTWINTAAKNGQIIDIKSIVLGRMLKRLGIGNPHRDAYSIVGTSTNAAATAINFQVALRNYDPSTLEETDLINGVKYSYRLVHDGALTGNIATSGATHFDMEEFTADTTGNAWSAVAAMDDAFYGNTVLFWTDIPSAFDFGVYYDGNNAMGGQFEARHALTYDDAGGLKYLYSTNNIAVEYLVDQPPGTLVLVEPAQFLPEHLAGYWSAAACLASSWGWSISVPDNSLYSSSLWTATPRRQSSRGTGE